MKALFAIMPETLPDVVIDDICEMAKLFPEEEGKIGPLDVNSEGKKDNTIRDCKIRWINPHSDDTKKLTNLCTSLFYDANRMFFGVDLTKIFHIQYTEYHGDAKGFYHTHIDSYLGTGELSDRKLSMTIQLSDSDEYEGGDFVLRDGTKDFPDKEQLRKKGTILVFPSFLNHSVQPVTNGIRKSLVTWIEGPAWR
jgi:PKHD-type hydroxylase